MDPDPGGPKTYGSGSATLANQRCLNIVCFWCYRAGEAGAESEDEEEEENEEEGAESYSDSAETDSVAGGTPTTEEEAALAARVEPSADSKPADEIISTAVGEAEAASIMPESNERKKSGDKDCESTSSRSEGSLPLPSGSGSSTSVIPAAEREEGEEGDGGLEGDLVEIRDTLREASREARVLLREVQDLN
jgi:hypothetical protein